MRDGSYYPAKGGHVTVDDPRHEREMETSLTLDKGYIERRKVIFDGADASVTCETCGFVGFLFQRDRPCPRCGGQFSAPDTLSSSTQETQP